MVNCCSACGAIQKNPNARFCAQCGQPLQPAAIPVPTPLPASPHPATTLLPGASFLVRYPNQAPTTYAISTATITLGRAPDNDLVLTYPAVSSRHARLEQHGSRYQLIDLGSTNGTTIGGRSLVAHQPHPLSSGDVIRIGDRQGNSISLTFQDSGSAVPVRRGTMLLDSSKLIGVPLITIGRDPACGLPLQSPIVSWRHAQIEHTPGGDVLSDLGATNGTYVNGQRISRHTLRQGDVIQIGPFRLPYTLSGLAPSANVGYVRLDGVHLKRRVKDRKSGGYKYILDDVTLSVQPGEFVAIVGGSGAGKSTLMKALNGQAHADEGRVLLNGDDFYFHFDQYRLMMGYVPQDDIVHRDLSVANALRYAARLRLPPDTQNAEIQRRVDDVLTRLDMIDKKNDTVATLSGGQRKRVNIAVEMLAEPDLFFLDEPSSGLDPGTEKKLMYDMQRLADSGKTVILITHATDNISLCDHVAFMGDGGHLVFFGPPREALTFFQAQSFADIYLKLNGVQEVQRWRQQYENSSFYQQYVRSRVAAAPLPSPGQTVQRSTTRPGSDLRQFAILAQRNLELIFRNKFSLFVLLAVMPIIGLLLLMIAKPFWLTGRYDPECTGILWSAPDAIADCVRFHLDRDLTNQPSATYTIANRAQVLLFMLAFASSLLGIFAASFEIVKEKAIFERERMINLKLGPYLLSKFAVLAGFGILQGFLLLFVISLGVRLPERTLLLPAPIELYVTLLLTIWASIGLGLVVSALVPNRDVVVYGMLVVLIVQILFAGVLFELPNEARPVSGATVTRWSLDALGISARLIELNQFGRLRVKLNRLPDPIEVRVAPDFQLSYGCSDEIEQTNSRNEVETIKQFNETCSRGALIGDWLMLAAFAAGFTALAGGILNLKERMAR